jgi:hypothetical protein
MPDDNIGRVILKISETGVEEAAVCADTPEQKKAGLELLSVILREIAHLDEALKMIPPVDNQPQRKTQRAELVSAIWRVRQAATEITLEAAQAMKN